MMGLSWEYRKCRFGGIEDPQRVTASREATSQRVSVLALRAEQYAASSHRQLRFHRRVHVWRGPGSHGWGARDAQE
jgi:hypothetical protein